LILRALTTVFLTGLVGGLFITGLQIISVFPLIIKAESFEYKEFENHLVTEESEITTNLDNNLNRSFLFKDVKSGILSEQNFESEHVDDKGGWIPSNGLERTFYTCISNIIIGVAFSLMLVAVYLLRGKSVNINSGFFWGSVGFAVFSLAPSLGLPPKLPGMSVAALEARQIWWIFTVIFTATGIGFLTESKSILFKVVAVILIVLPQIIGAPNPHLFKSVIPIELSSQFTSATLLTSAFFWIVVGMFSGFLYKKLVQEFTVVSSA